MEREPQYIDPLTLDFSKFKVTSTPREVIITDFDKARFDLFVYSHYSSVSYKDILLIFNHVESRYDLQPGQKFLLPSYDDLTTFWVSQRR
jgi:hypothetical protein